MLLEMMPKPLSLVGYSIGEIRWIIGVDEYSKDLAMPKTAFWINNQALCREVFKLHGPPLERGLSSNTHNRNIQALTAHKPVQRYAHFL